jgi:hypothetical protein
MSQRRDNENPKVFDAQKSEQALSALVVLKIIDPNLDDNRRACARGRSTTVRLRVCRPRR